MKKKVLFLASFLFIVLVASKSFAVLTNVKRTLENYWFASDNKVFFGSNPNASINYTGGNLVLDIMSGGGKVSVPDGMDLGTSNLNLASSLVFEGSTEDAFETTVSVTNPTDDRAITLPNATGTVIVSGAAASLASVAATGSVLSSSATDIGWSVVSGANTACNTTCTNACVFGQNTGDMSIVNCAAATADVCVCAGAN